MLRLDQQGELVLIPGVEEFQVESLVGAVCWRHRPRSPVTGHRLIKPAVRRRAGARYRVIPGSPKAACSAAAFSRAAGRLVARASASGATSASRAHRTDCPSAKRPCHPLASSRCRKPRNGGPGVFGAMLMPMRWPAAATAGTHRHLARHERPAPGTAGPAGPAVRPGTRAAATSAGIRGGDDPRREHGQQNQGHEQVGAWLGDACPPPMALSLSATAGGSITAPYQRQPPPARHPAQAPTAAASWAGTRDTRSPSGAT
jgi:hypothetical protein